MSLFCFNYFPLHVTTKKKKHNQLMQRKCKSSAFQVQWVQAPVSVLPLLWDSASATLNIDQPPPPPPPTTFQYAFLFKGLLPSLTHHELTQKPGRSSVYLSVNTSKRERARYRERKTDRQETDLKLASDKRHMQGEWSGNVAEWAAPWTVKTEPESESVKGAMTIVGS